MRRPTVARVSALLIACASCSTAPPDTRWHSEAGYRWRELAIAARGRAGFEQRAAPTTGIVHQNDIDELHGLDNRGLLNGAGVAVGDVDGDDLVDVFLASQESPAVLYHNEGRLHFTDVTAASGLTLAGVKSTSAVLADVDGDRDLDLIVGTFGGQVLLFLNDGHGHFSDATARSGLTGGYMATTMTLADVDGNGSLDLYVATYKTHNALDVYPPQARAFDQVLKQVGGAMTVVDEWKAEYRVETRPDLGGFLRSQRAEPDLFFLNDGAGHFTRTPMMGARFRDEDGRPLTQEPDYFTLAARFYDVNNDGAPDLYVCNDLEDPDQFWINDGAGNFRLALRSALRVTSNTCMSVDFADVDRDGNVDIFTTDMLSPTLAARQRQIPTHTPLQKPVGRAERTQWMRNMLHRSRGDGTWSEIGEFAGVAATDWTWASAFLDVDLDGYDDLLTVNGHRYDVREADPYERIRNSFPRVPWNRESKEFPRLATTSVAMRNNGDLTFGDASRAWGFGVDSAISQGMALADLDGDGATDVVVTRLDAPAVLYRSTTSAPRVAVRLRGRAPNTQGIGALITVSAASLAPQTREVTSGGYYLSGSDTQLAFATGADRTVAIDVRWRNGTHSRIARAMANRLYEIDEASASPTPAPERPVPAPLFVDASALLGGASHADSLYADFRRQPLLPTRLSQLGPGVSWIDVDGDGRDDLVFATGRGGTLNILRNVGARFARMPMNTASASYDLTTVLPYTDDTGHTALLVGQSSYETSTPAEALSLPGVLRVTPLARPGGAPAVPLVDGDTASMGALAMADVDGDGELDLFVGARVIPGAWPLPARSRLYRGRSGKFVPDTANAAVLAHLGLVSSAVFADLDGDARPELIVATEWGPVRVLHNEAGRYRDVTAAWGMSALTSRWNGVTVGDFDGDGALDIVATSWGENIPWHASTDRPHVLVATNMNGAGLALIFARADSLTHREMPLDPLSRLGAAIPSLHERFATYAAFAAADVDALLGAAAKNAVRVGATTFAHTLFLNRSGRMEPHVLPAAAQLAPSFGPVVADFDGDGSEDLFLAQNFFPTEINTMRFDAGVGALLLGNGRGAFIAQTVNQSGIAVFGDQRGAATADYDGDARPDLAVAQNGAAMTLWRNTRARVGLRVTLRGPVGNPLAIGARLRVARGATLGPVREVHGGSGYWSMDAATTVMALPDGATALQVRWPTGRLQTVPISGGQHSVTLVMSPL